MNNEWLTYVWEHYNILGSFLALAGIVVITKVGKRLVFSVPDLGKMRQMNKDKDKPKWDQEKYWLVW